MSLEERKSLIKAGCEYAAGRVPVMAGVGCSTAKETIELANFAAECGATWGIGFASYYHKTSEEGILDFFQGSGCEIKCRNRHLQLSRSY
ncbi:dihydrodipicolinate synthase family protein [Peribacillus frigoritolerans]|nr:dihydrodipicolinate synthase family protein [Peribacillus frigoritolerans]